MRRPVLPPDPVAAARLAQDATAAVLDGLVLVLLPERIEDPDAFVRTVADLARLSDGERFRLAVADVAELHDLLPGEATFAVDEAALLRYLKDLGRPSSKGPPISRPKVSPALKERLAREGKIFPSEATGFDYRALLLDGAEAMASGDVKRAAKKFRAARMLCRLTGMKEQEAATSIGLGSIVFGMGDPKRAVYAFRRGREIADSLGNNALAAQAELGVAAVLFAGKDWDGARACYCNVQQLAAALPSLVIEATRMEGECLRMAGSSDRAATTYARALEVAMVLPPDARAATSAQHAARALAAIVGEERARAIASLIEARAAQRSEDRP